MIRRLLGLRPRRASAVIRQAATDIAPRRSAHEGAAIRGTFAAAFVPA